MSSALPARKKRYHKRSSWACDECKLRKKKCDGEQPCAMCTLIGTPCLYESKHRPHKPVTQRVRELEEQARSFRDLLSRVKHEVSGSSLAEVERMLSTFESNASDDSPSAYSPSVATFTPRIPLTTILDGRGKMLESGQRQMFFGPCSSTALICAMLDFFDGTDSTLIHDPILDLFEKDVSSLWGPDVAEPLMNLAIPSQEEMVGFLDVIRKQTHPSFRIVDTPQFLQLLDVAYKIEAAHTISTEFTFIHAAAALGYLLSTEHHAKTGCKWNMSKASQHYRVAMGTLSRSTRNSVQSLLVCVYLILYASCSFQLSEAYAILSGARSLVITQGLLYRPEKNISGIEDGKLSPLKQLVVTMEIIDGIVSTTLGLPRTLDFNKPELRGPVAPDTPDLDLRTHVVNNLTSSTATIMSEMCAMISINDPTTQEKKSVDQAILEQADQSHIACAQMLDQFTASQSKDTSSRMPKQGLLTTFWWSELMVYSPFLHYLQPLADGQPLPPNHSEPALRCLKTATNTINTCEGMLRSRADSALYLRIMHPANVGTVSALFISTLSLIFLICVHKGTKPPGEAWRRAEMGIRLLEALRCDAGGAGRCIAIIREMVRQLNHFVHFDFELIEKTTQRVCSGDGERRDLQPNFAYAEHSPVVPPTQYSHTGLSDVSTSADEILAYAHHVSFTDHNRMVIP